jgi:amidohydrolase
VTPEDILVELPELEPEIIGWRRHFHEHPELSYDEHETARFVEWKLQRWGLEPERPTPTSVVARLRGDLPGPTIALRADMDALPIEEENTFEFASKHPGVMHACGHDGHTAMLLGVAQLMSRRGAEVPGEVRFVFQHAEEKPPGGAVELVEAGVLEGVDAIVGAHLMSIIDTGQIVVLPGPELAAADLFEITVRGRGGHGAMPQQTVDPVAVAAQLVSALQLPVSRQTDPLDSAVLSITRIVGGSAHNVIPETVELWGTVRTFRPETREEIRESMARISESVTAAFGAEADFRWVEGYPAVVNDPRVAGMIAEAASAVVGNGGVVDIPPIMGGEDFSAYLARTPGAFVLVGARSEEAESAYPHHHPRFTVDERALPIGVAVLVRSALALLEHPPTEGD